jgi:deoxyribodipyrimidine photolyase-related protein
MTITIWILGDQLTPDHPAINQLYDHEHVRILMIESKACIGRLPFHPKKLVLLLSAMRHRGESLRKAGFSVDYRQGENMLRGLLEHCNEYQPERLITMRASSYQGYEFQLGLSKRLGVSVEILPNNQFLSNRFDPLPDIDLEDDVRQECFYRAMRRHWGLLMDSDRQPVGGVWNFDKQNRKPLPSEIDPPAAIRFDPDPLTGQVMDEIDQQHRGFGVLDGFNLAVTPAEAQRAADDFIENRLAYFGTYEDAMSKKHTLLYHSKLSPYLNLGLLDPLDLARRAEEAYREGRVTINNAEGFIRQVIGWREYMVWQYQRLMPKLAEANMFNAQHPLPEFFWSCETDMNCLRHVLIRVRKDGYAHHIERLMLLSNFCTLAGIAPKAVLDWFQSAFIDAYDWVMVTNVIGMGLHADGGRIGTKPYIASANYINKMGDYCKDCRYKHTKRTGGDACPFNFLYWRFLLQHEDSLRENPHMARMLHNLKYLGEEERERVRRAGKVFLL